jgi:hypothetical protein
MEILQRISIVLQCALGSFLLDPMQGCCADDVAFNRKWIHVSQDVSLSAFAMRLLSKLNDCLIA